MIFQLKLSREGGHICDFYRLHRVANANQTIALAYSEIIFLTFPWEKNALYICHLPPKIDP